MPAIAVPNKNQEYEKGELFYQEVIKLMKEKHRINTDMIGIIDQSDMDRQLARLKASLKEILWLDACDSF